MLRGDARRREGCRVSGGRVKGWGCGVLSGDSRRGGVPAWKEGYQRGMPTRMRDGDAGCGVKMEVGGC